MHGTENEVCPTQCQECGPDSTALGRNLALPPNGADSLSPRRRSGGKRAGERTPRHFDALCAPEPASGPLTRPSGTLSPSGGEGWGEGVRFMGRAGERRRVLI